MEVSLAILSQSAKLNIHQFVLVKSPSLNVHRMYNLS